VFLAPVVFLHTPAFLPGEEMIWFDEGEGLCSYSYFVTVPNPFSLSFIAFCFFF
jgi:hypothetical protein